MSDQRPPEDIHQALVAMCDRGGAFAVAVILQSEGSTPGHAGASALIDAAGAIQGTIGGGLVEAEAQRRAVEAIKTGRPEIMDFNLQGGAVVEGEPICGGTMRVLIDPTAGHHRLAYAAAVEAGKQRERGVLLTTIRGLNERETAVAFLPEDAIPSDLQFPTATALRSVLEREETELFTFEPPDSAQHLEILAEPLVPRPILLIAGGGHVGQAVARQASLVGFDIVVIDDRPEFTAPALFPAGVATRCGNIAAELAAFPVGADTYVVIVTRGHQQDNEALAACLRRPAAYLGMIGSRRKVAMVRRDFLETGRATPAEFDRVHAPIGLDIGSVTVPEIAASIVAELIAVRRRGRPPRSTSRPAP